ncbi:MAG TPA: LysR family transcriptional regulator [Burkholderiaceae bacterium]
MTSIDRLGGIAAFVHAAEAGSFSAAAERMHLSRSAVVKSVARLEERVGAQLFHRTTRSQSLTDAGSAFYKRCVRALAELELAEEEVGSKHDEIAGKVRITMPVELGRRCIAPVLFALAQRHPRMELEMSLTDRRVDMVEEGYDVAIRSGPLPDSHEFKMRPLGEEALVVCAAPAYLASHGTPAAESDLAQHNGILYGRLNRLGHWHFRSSRNRETVAAIPARICVDDLDAILTAAKSGLGIARLPGWLAAEALREGSVVRLLPHLEVASIPLHAVWPQTRHLSRKLRVVIDELAAQLPPTLSAVT